MHVEALHVDRVEPGDRAGWSPFRSREQAPGTRAETGFSKTWFGMRREEDVLDIRHVHSNVMYSRFQDT